MYVRVCPFSRSFDDKALTYKSGKFTPQPGSVVKVPYGKKEIYALVLGVGGDAPDIDLEKLKEVTDIIYDMAFLNREQLELLLFLSEYYFCLLHKSLSLFFPRNLKEKIEKQTLKFPEEYLKYNYNNSQILTSVQNEKLQEIQKQKQLQTLFYGVTGSGKTSIYIELIKKQGDSGKQSLLLVPEIILTSQIARKMTQVFGDNVLIIHSGIPEAQKTKIWMKIHSGEAKVVVGTRSALFYPYRNLGLIIIDEEHDRSYISDNAPRYDAREVARKMSDLYQIPLLLGSGTPSTNTMYQAIKKRIGLVTLLDEYKK